MNADAKALPWPRRKIVARSLYRSGPGDGRSVLGPDFDDPNMEFDLGRDYGPGIEF